MSAPLRVLHVAQPTDGGVGRYVETIAVAERDAGMTVAVASPPGELADNLGSAGVETISWPARRGPGPHSIGELVRLRRVIAAWGPDVVHLHSSKAGLVGRLAVRRHRPTIFQPHAWSFHVDGRAARLAGVWERIGARYADVVVCVSEAELDEGRSYGVDARFVVIQNGVDTTGLAPVDAAERIEIRKRLALPVGAPIAVCAGRLAHQKGQDVLLSAWPSVLADVPDAVLVLVGDGPLRAELASVIAGDVRMVGHRPDVGDWLRAADVVVLPSRWEGFSLLLLEAMACGAAIVATDVAGVRESLGCSAPESIVPVEDADALAAAVAVRLESRALACDEGARSRAVAVERFDRARVAADVIALTRGLGRASGT
jgi:glycosyltransferase involved in cell wall biosynthesis